MALKYHSRRSFCYCMRKFCVSIIIFFIAIAIVHYDAFVDGKRNHHNFLGECAKDFRTYDVLKFKVIVEIPEGLLHDDDVEICSLVAKFADGSKWWWWPGAWGLQGAPTMDIPTLEEEHHETPWIGLTKYCLMTDCLTT